MSKIKHLKEKFTSLTETQKLRWMYTQTGNHIPFLVKWLKEDFVSYGLMSPPFDEGIPETMRFVGQFIQDCTEKKDINESFIRLKGEQEYVYMLREWMGDNAEAEEITKAFFVCDAILYLMESCLLFTSGYDGNEPIPVADRKVDEEAAYKCIASSAFAHISKQKKAAMHWEDEELMEQFELITENITGWGEYIEEDDEWVAELERDIIIPYLKKSLLPH